MSIRAKCEYVRAIYARYRQAPRETKGQILDEFCASTGYHRTAALRLLNGPPPGRARPRRRRRAATYGAAVSQALTVIWEAAAAIPGPCGSRPCCPCGCPGRAAGSGCRPRCVNSSGRSARDRSIAAWP